MAYVSTPTFAQFRTQLAARLDDYNRVFWGDPELKRLTWESLRAWNAFAQFSRDTVAFTTVAGQVFYDLAQNPQLSASLGSKLMTTLKDQDLVLDMEYHLLEVPNNWSVSQVWDGTDMFTMDDLVRAVERRRNQFLLETGMMLTHSTPAGPTANGNGIVSLSDSIIDVRRVAFTDSVLSSTRVLDETDEWTATHFAAGWNGAPGNPLAWSEFQNPHVSLQLLPPNLNAGTLDLLTVNSPADLNVATGALLHIPDDFAWVIKWGALADLLGRDGQARDPNRAAYCEQRWQEGLLAAKFAASVNLIQLSSSFIGSQSLSDVDQFNPTWVNAAQATPTQSGMASWNMLWVSPPPTGGQTVTLDIVRNQPLPSADTDVLQIGREQVDAVLDYAVHLASFKMGGDEFMATGRGYENMVRLAMEHNKRLAAQAKGFRFMQDVAWKEFKQRPMKEEAA